MAPVRLQAVEMYLEGQPVGPASHIGDVSNQGNPIDTKQLLAALQAGMADFQPPSDFRASSGYRRVSGGNLAFRALEEATNISRWRSMVSSEGRA
jgi:xanthine dehydrogenase iron-sulfur cluster and FAD-binding subunit A